MVDFPIILLMIKLSIYRLPTSIYGLPWYLIPFTRHFYYSSSEADIIDDRGTLIAYSLVINSNYDIKVSPRIESSYFLKDI